MTCTQEVTTVSYARNFRPLQSTKAVAALGGGTPRYMRKLCEAGTLKAVKCGTTWRINAESALEFFGLTPQDAVGIFE